MLNAEKTIDKFNGSNETGMYNFDMSSDLIQSE